MDKGAASCQGTGLCDVAGDCAVYPAGTICQIGGCSDNGRDLMPVRLCDGTGKCDDGKADTLPGRHDLRDRRVPVVPGSGSAFFLPRPATG